MYKRLKKIKRYLLEFLIPKIKFALSSSVATLIDYVLYLALVSYVFAPVVSNIISAFTGMLVNFTLQKRYVFILQRKLSSAFLLSLMFSLGGIGLSTFLIYLLNKIEVLTAYQYLIKLFVSGIVFFYNFYTKRYAFENKRINIKKAKPDKTSPDK